MEYKTIGGLITNNGRRRTSGFAKVRQSEIVLEYFSGIDNCRTCRKAAKSLNAMQKHNHEKHLLKK